MDRGRELARRGDFERFAGRAASVEEESDQWSTGALAGAPLFCDERSRIDARELRAGRAVDAFEPCVGEPPRDELRIDAVLVEDDDAIIDRFADAVREE